MLSAPKREPVWCTYCGRLADTMDHAVPRHLMERAEEIGYRPQRRKFLVPACHECNTALGGRIHLTLAERRQDAKEAIRRRYERALRMPHWTETELAQLSLSLQREIRMTQRVREETERRLAWYPSACVDDGTDVFELYRLATEDRP